MKAFLLCRPWPVHLIVPLLLGCLLLGCATPKVDWSSRVGHYTFDQAVMDYGPPDKQAALQDGSKVAEWLTQRGYVQNRVSPGYGYGYPYYYGPLFPTYIDTYRSPDHYLRLIFGPDGKLRDWKIFYR